VAAYGGMRQHLELISDAPHAVLAEPPEAPLIRASEGCTWELTSGVGMC
jgi:hypothetical protein